MTEISPIVPLIYPWRFCSLQWLWPAGLYKSCKLALELKMLKTPVLKFPIVNHQQKEINHIAIQGPPLSESNFLKGHWELSFVEFWNVHINCYNFMIFIEYVLQHKREEIQNLNSINVWVSETIISLLNFKSVAVAWSVESLPSNPGVRVRFPAGSGILMSLLGLGGVLCLCSVLCCLRRRTWYCADHTFRQARPCVSV